MEPFLITIGNQAINPSHIVRAIREDEGGEVTVRIYMAGFSPDEPLIIKGGAARITWEEIAALSKRFIYE